MNIQIDLRSDIPITNQIVEQIQHQLATGQIRPGDQLPTVRALALDLRVNFNTVARAYRMLDEAGLISTQQGRGTFILDQPAEGLRDLLKKETLEVQSARFLAEMIRQGYSLDEVKRSIEENAAGWQNDQPD